MPKNFDDRVQAEVNKRLTQAASAAGVDRGRIEIEVLFLLPPEFVRRYRELFDRALADPIKPNLDSGKDEGRLRAAGKPADAMKARSMGGAKHGKKFVAGSWPVRDEHALEAKRKLDRRIVNMVEEAIGSIGAAHDGDSTVTNQCSQCGLFQRDEWLRCPYHA